MDTTTRFSPTGKEPPPSTLAAEVAEDLGWSVARLLGLIATGQLPPPHVVNGVFRFTSRYANAVRASGPHLPGTFTGLPPGRPFPRERKPTKRKSKKPKYPTITLDQLRGPEVTSTKGGAK